MQFVLIHGSWHTGSCWDGVSRHLEAEGHRVLAPTLPGNGTGADRTVDMATTYGHVVDLIADNALEDVVLVAHSLGGAVAQLVAQEIPSRIRRLVFHNAYVIADGRCVFDYVPEESAEAFQTLAVDGELMIPFEVFHAGFMNDVDEDTARATYSNLTPEPLARAAEPLSLSDFPTLPIPRSVVHAVDDQVFGGPQFWHPEMSSRLGEFRLHEIPGSHEVLYSNPRRLASAILEASLP